MHNSDKKFVFFISDFGFDGPSFALIFAAIVLSLLAVFFMKVLDILFKILSTHVNQTSDSDSVL